MTLLDRVATLLRANLNDLVGRAEDPEKLLRQLLLDMQNQHLQLKTQVAVAITGQHQLEKQQRENEAAREEWMQKAELAVKHNQEALARVALERALTHENAAKKFVGQLADQKNQVELLRDSLHRLESKMAETKAQVEMLIAQHRRARNGAPADRRLEHESTLERVQAKVAGAEVQNEAQFIAQRDLSAEDELARLQKSDRVERMLSELKQRLPDLQDQER